MAAAMNGIALNGGFIPYGGTFLVFTDYCRAGDPPVGADAPARDLRDDARLDRAGRGWSDASADRAPRGAAGDPASARAAACRWRRDRRVLGDRAAAHAEPVHPGAVAAGGAERCASRTSARTCSAKGAYVLREPDGNARRDADRDRLRGRHRHRQPPMRSPRRACAPRSCRCRRWSCSGAQLRSLPCAGAWLGPARRHRGRRHPVLARMARRQGGGFVGLERFRRLGARAEAVRALRAHGRARRSRPRAAS